MRCARSACAWRSTTSAPATRRSARSNQLPIDRIKIDRSFVSDLPHHPGNAAIVRAIVMLAAGLGREVIAEGVETEAQRAFLAGLGCPVLQGQLFGAPRADAPFAT